jgi:type VI secretion system protein ImpM
MRVPPAVAAPGWYGKLPAAGDFVHRRLSHELIFWWDRWLQHGLAALRGGADDAQALRDFETSPAWNFAIPAGIGAGRVQLGVIGPSCDRVGRRYPLCVVSHLDAEDYDPRILENSGDYYRQIGACLLGAVRHGHGAEQLDQALSRQQLSLPAAQAHQASAGSPGGDIMAILNAGLDVAAPLEQDSAPAFVRGPAWAELSTCFNPGSHTSYWWTNQADGSALHTHVHGGALNASLFGKLFSSSGAPRR